ncbi:tRNA (adenosine(37)-N6)-threonylcarbamoyltransferase complex ATPase subunit type 1 TsaE [Psychrobacter sp. HD31]|uniref:tRNA (adenosine(37)-N6)-threonylcarbamoyltransferase complex ATPase subunit type 1 TsaE n=1 Tax=Psychrobacter sp. HD31 TaxID=3112003 RepID=UPI003DA42B4C
MSKVSIVLTSEEDTQKLGEQLAKLNISGCVFLSGDLGAGKTTLTRYWLRALGHSGAVKSPTYTLVEPYSIVEDNNQNKPVYHADFYRLQDPEELSFIGFDEYLEEDKALAIIEWASKADGYLPEPVLLINIAKQDDDSRMVTITLTKATEKLNKNINIDLLKSI